MPFAIATCVGLAASVAALAAQAPSIPQEAIPLKVEVVLSRSQGTKKISSLPYTLVVPALPYRDNPVVQPQGQSTSLRLGVDVFTGRTLILTTNDGKTSSTPEYQYIGTNIDCRADFRTAGVYRVYMNLTDAALSAATSGEGAVTSVPAGVRRFSASNTLTVRDGQPSQFTVGTDPLTGETIRVEVTATAIK
ncbi:MAG: hypothetical protein ABI634_14125 [Acidobacteriota bacterium]